MRPSPLTRLVWLLQDVWELSPLARVRSRVHALRSTRGAKAIAGLVVALLLVGGFVAARSVARTPDIASPRTPDVITVQRRVLERVGGQVGTRWRLRTVYAHGRKVVQTAAPRTVDAVRVVTIAAAGNGKTRTVAAPVTDSETHTSTRLVTVTHPVTATVTHPVTVVATTTILSIKTVSVPVTITVTVP